MSMATLTVAENLDAIENVAACILAMAKSQYTSGESCPDCDKE
jgi:hypothetical protein